MEDKELITNATQLLSELNKSFQSCKQGTADDFRLQELLNATLQELKKAEKLDNSILINLEKFYQRTSLLIGLSSLTTKLVLLGGTMTNSITSMSNTY